MDVIVRHEMCEKAKPGDICVFTGTLMAIPDAAQLLLSGRHLSMQRATSEKGRRNDVRHWRAGLVNIISSRLVVRV